jgi:beta-1,4-mannosyltransferase
MNEKPQRLRVLQSVPALRETTNPYLKQLIDSLSAVADVSLFSWRRALTGRFDVLHIHWPDVLIKGQSIPKTFARRMAFAAMLIRWSFGRRAIVRTVHNVAPHEKPSAVDRLLLAWCDRLTDVWIVLTPNSPLPRQTSAPVHHISHGHYRDWFADRDRDQVHPGKVLFFGLVRRYKGVDRLIQAFSGVPDKSGPGCRTRIAGHTGSESASGLSAHFGRRARP